MSRKLLQTGIVLMLVLAIGGNWALVQSVAWVRMAVGYSRCAPLGTALRMTFDGQHPCTLCKIVQDGKKTEREKRSTTPDTKLDLLCRVHGLMLLPPPLISASLGSDDRGLLRLEPPPIPPPRFA
ncbi:MAG: hypothetical protein QOF48_568 [Verrucomicrobiota bacterium]|jgi:hypothetical protein